MSALADLPEVCEDCLNTGQNVLNPDWPEGDLPYCERSHCGCEHSPGDWPSERLLKRDGNYIKVTQGQLQHVSGLRVRAIRYPDGTTSWVAEARLIDPEEQHCPQCKKVSHFAPDDYICWACRNA